MEVTRGEIWWADLPDASAPEEPGYPRPMLVVQGDYLNRSALPTFLAVPLTTSLRRGEVPGHVRLDRGTAGLDRDSIIQTTLIYTLNRSRLRERIGRLDHHLMVKVDRGLLIALGL